MILKRKQLILDLGVFILKKNLKIVNSREPMWVHSADRRRMSFCLPGSDGRSLERSILALPDYGTPW